VTDEVTALRLVVVDSVDVEAFTGRLCAGEDVEGG
jgi:hypothetical protein